MYRKSVYFLVIAVAAILVLGIVMLFSTSAFAHDAHGDAFYFVKRQSMWLGIGVIGCITGSLVDYHFWRRTCWIWFGVSFVLLALCFVPHIGMRINGSRRWVKLHPASPSSRPTSRNLRPRHPWHGGSRSMRTSRGNF